MLKIDTTYKLFSLYLELRLKTIHNNFGVDISLFGKCSFQTIKTTLETMMR